MKRWSVVEKYFDSGNIRISLKFIEEDDNPEYELLPKYDVYRTYYNNKNDALNEALKKAMKELKKQNEKWFIEIEDAWNEDIMSIFKQDPVLATSAYVALVTYFVNQK